MAGGTGQMFKCFLVETIEFCRPDGLKAWRCKTARAWVNEGVWPCTHKTL